MTITCLLAENIYDLYGLKHNIAKVSGDVIEQTREDRACQQMAARWLNFAKCDHLNFRIERRRAATHPTFEGVGSATVDLRRRICICTIRVVTGSKGEG